MAQFGQYQPAPEQQFNYQQAGGQGPSQMKKILMIGGLFFVVIIIIMIGLSLISGSGDSGPGDNVSRVVARQQNILALIENYQENTRSLDTQTKVAQINAVLISDTQALYGVGAAAVPNAIAAVSDSTLDSQLSSAAAGTNFDSVFISALEEQLSLNLTDLAAADAASSNQTLKAVIGTAYENQSQLIE